MGVASYCTFLHDVSFPHLQLSFNLSQFTRFTFVNNEFYENRLNFRTFKDSGGEWKIS